MKTFIRLMMVVLVALTLGACASKNSSVLPDFAITNSGERTSQFHKKEAQKKGFEFVTTWNGVMSDELMVEVEKKNGTFPVMGSDGEKIFMGNAYFVKLHDSGYWIVQYDFPYGVELEKAQFALFNQDGGFAYSMTGKQIVGIDKDRKEFNPYNIEKFNHDDEAKKEFLKTYGTSFAELNKSLQGIFTTAEIENNLIRYKVGSQKWCDMVNEFRAKIKSGEMSEKKMPNGEIRVARMSVEELAARSASVSDFKTSGRLIKATTVSVGVIAEIAYAPVMPIISVANTVYSANVDNDWHGHTLRSKFWGFELASTFGFICDEYRKLLAERDAAILKLQNEIYFLKLLNRS